LFDSFLFKKLPTSPIIKVIGLKVTATYPESALNINSPARKIGSHLRSFERQTDRQT